MSLGSTDTQIKECYENLGLSPSLIAEQLSFDEGAVKAKLMCISSKYRKDCGKEDKEEDDLNFTKDQLRDINTVFIEAALTATNQDGSPDWRVRLDAAKYVRDDKKGRKDIKAQLAGNTFNILNFNEAIQAARQGASKLRDAVQGAGQKVIET